MNAKEFPASLVQIHYHNRQGGVHQVTRCYSTAFRKLAGDSAPNFLICSGSGAQMDSGAAEIINMPECDYNQFTDFDSFCKTRDSLLSKLGAVLSGARLHYPIVVIGHNLTLGKNAALSSAFSQIARKVSDKRIRFFSMVHDFAEEWRIELLKSLYFLESTGINIMPDIYALGAPVHYLAPQKSVADILSSVGFSASLLPNPVEHTSVTEVSALREIAVKQISEFAKADGVGFDGSKPLYYYPSRIIYRKNYLEAIFLASAVLNVNLITGPPGFREEDLCRYKKMVDFVKRFNLPVVFNPGEKIEWGTVIKGKTVIENPTPYLYAISDGVLSTSVAEGFGYGLYEPWFYDKGVIGRCPAGFSYPEGMDFTSLYTRFPVPLEWVSIEELKTKLFLQFAINRICKKEDMFRMVTADESVDFGILDEETQFSILEKVFTDERMRAYWIQFIDEKGGLWRGGAFSDGLDTAKINHNQKIVNEQFSNVCFPEKFGRCVSLIPTPIPYSTDYGKIPEKIYFSGFRLSDHL